MAAVVDRTGGAGQCIASVIDGNCRLPLEKMPPSRGSVRVRTQPCKSDRVRSTGQCQSVSVLLLLYILYLAAVTMGFDLIQMKNE